MAARKRIDFDNGEMSTCQMIEKAFDQKKIVVMQRMDQEFVGSLTRDSVRFAAQVDLLHNQLVGALMAQVVAGKVEVQEHAKFVELAVHYPATAWEHFKRDYMPMWFVNRWPVKFEVKKKSFSYVQRTETTKVCPHADMEWRGDPGAKVHVRWLEY